jgi:hypothetical protein
MLDDDFDEMSVPPPEAPWDGPMLLGNANDLAYPFDPDIETAAAKQRRWEHAVVRRLLTRFNLLAEAPAMKSIAREQLGIGRLTFEAFVQVHPDFPLWLTAVKIPNVHKLSYSDWDKDWKKNPVYKNYVEAEANVPDRFADYSGLVFEWLHHWPVAIIHNRYEPLVTPGTVWHIKVKAVTDQLLAIQSFDTWLAALKWRPS